MITSRIVPFMDNAYIYWYLHIITKLLTARCIEQTESCDLFCLESGELGHPTETVYSQLNDIGTALTPRHKTQYWARGKPP